MIFKGERRTIKVNITTNEVELDKTDKEIARLFYNGFRAKDIAKRLEITTSSVYNRLHRIRYVQEVKRWWD